MTIRVVLADDHPMYRYGLSAVLDQSEAVDVVATASNGEELLRAVDQHAPDVVVTDLSMPNVDGVAATEALLQAHPAVAVLALTMHEDDAHLRAAIRAGVAGYLVKGADGAEIIRAILALAAGDALYGAPVVRRLAQFYAGEAPTTTAFPHLTPRERDVLELLAHGLRNHDIARRLSLSDKTIRNHVSQILLKLQVPDRTAAALKASEAGMGNES